MKKYWFYLEPYTFLWNTENDFLIYNSLSHQGKKFHQDKDVNPVIKQLQIPQNNYVVELNEEELQKDSIKELVNFAQNTFSGDLLDKELSNGKPIVLKPTLDLQTGIGKVIKKNATDLNVGDSVLSYLHELSIYIGGEKSHSLLADKGVFLQFDYTANLNQGNIAIKKLTSFFESINEAPVSHFNILGGNIIDYPAFDSLITSLNYFSGEKIFYLSLVDFPSESKKLSFLQTKSYQLKLLIEFPVNQTYLENIIHSLLEQAIKVQWLFAVTSISEYEKTTSIIRQYKLKNIEIKPTFTGENIQFFEDYVFLAEDDLLNSELDRRDIFTKQALNTYDFGKLTILPDGKIYANLNCPALGTLTDFPKELLRKEISQQTSWRRIRNQEPCNQCVYQWLCPSPSNYELVIGKPNLCTVE